MKPNTIEFIQSRLISQGNGCLLAPGIHSKNGYSVVSFEGRMWYTHCLLYAKLVGPVPDGYDLHHRCRQRNCANIEHLEMLTRKEHATLGYYPNREKTHCPEGHPYSGDNLYIHRDGRRSCRTCRRATKERMRRRRGATVGRRRGESHHASKLKLADIKAIRDMVAAGQTRTAAAVRFNISVAHACRIVKAGLDKNGLNGLGSSSAIVNSD